MTPHTHPAVITFMPTCPACIEANPDRVAAMNAEAQEAAREALRETWRESQRRRRAAQQDPDRPKGKQGARGADHWRYKARVRREQEREARMATLRLTLER